MKFELGLFCQILYLLSNAITALFATSRDDPVGFVLSDSFLSTSAIITRRSFSKGTSIVIMNAGMTARGDLRLPCTALVRATARFRVRSTGSKEHLLGCAGPITMMSHNACVRPENRERPPGLYMGPCVPLMAQEGLAREPHDTV